jgi:hypothetical protein
MPVYAQKSAWRNHFTGSYLLKTDTLATSPKMSRGSLALDAPKGWCFGKCLPQSGSKLPRDPKPDQGVPTGVD